MKLRPRFSHRLNRFLKTGRNFTASERAAITVWWERREEFEFAEDTIQPHEIPRSGSFCNWMRNHREAITMK